MEPRQEAVPGRGEIPQAQVPGVEASVGVGHEAKTGVSQEAQPVGQTLGAAQAAVQAAMPVLPTPVTVEPIAQDGSADASAPIIANDDDLIEKEWVDKAKQIIAATKDDPYRREQEVSKLQIEYIRRRYGREIGDAGD
ncbi:MAG: hypothetical protein WBP22_05095 [Candidatus Saccharimonas sp.]